MSWDYRRSDMSPERGYGYSHSAGEALAISKRSERLYEERERASRHEENPDYEGLRTEEEARLEYEERSRWGSRKDESMALHTHTEYDDERQVAAKLHGPSALFSSHSSSHRTYSNEEKDECCEHKVMMSFAAGISERHSHHHSHHSEHDRYGSSEDRHRRNKVAEYGRKIRRKLYNHDGEYLRDMGSDSDSDEYERRERGSGHCRGSDSDEEQENVHYYVRRRGIINGY